MKCDRCPIDIEECGYPPPENCHLTDRDKLIIRAMIAGDYESSSTSTSSQIHYKRWGDNWFLEVWQPKGEE